ncbi:MAG: DNA repair protein RecO [Deltaproteobacteria bacterium RBG_13_65_10]|nr:MAG: DNA repair protein RecO [Deltaproteobacteria bacterium RBG_13_65_10]
MAQQQSPAIVLRATEFGESDLIVHCFTREFGRLRGVAKGAKRSMKRFVGSLDFLAYVDLRFFEKKTSDLVRVDAATFRSQFPGIREDLDKLAEASLLAEIVTFGTGERETHRPLFDTLLRGLALIDHLPRWKPAGCGIGRMMEARVLSLMGFEPNLSACVRCRKALDAIRRADFSVARGGIVCERCAITERDLIPVGVATLKLLAQGLRAEVDAFPRFAWTSRSAVEAARILHPFAQVHLGRELRTLRFMTSLARAIGG